MNSNTKAKCIIGIPGNSYYFPHALIKELTDGDIKFVDENGNKLVPKYFGASLTGLNGMLNRYEP